MIIYPNWSKPMSKDPLIKLYDDVLSFLDKLHDYRSYYSGSHYHTLPSGQRYLNKRFRAVYQVPDPSIYIDNVKSFESRYESIIKEVNKDKKGFDPAKKIQPPLYLPRVVENYAKIQIHENVAHKSEKLTSKKWLNLTMMFGVNDSNELQEYNKYAEQRLKEIGLETSLVDDELTVSVASICNRFECDSIQLRTRTGRQIRANYFVKDRSGMLEKSQLKSVGTLITNQLVTVEKSLQRSIRSDAIYAIEHPDEIKLPLPIEINARIYANR